MTFAYWGRELEYLDHPYNNARLNERAVEVPIALDWLAEQTGKGFELGNVTSHYGAPPHSVIDRYEVADGVDNGDVFNITAEFDWILAISTLEHVRWDEEPKNPDGSGNALNHLYNLLAPGGKMLVTVPFGWQPFFDSAIIAGEAGPLVQPVRECTMLRQTSRLELPEWVMYGGAVHERYAKTSIWAEAVWVAEFEK